MSRSIKELATGIVSVVMVFALVFIVARGISLMLSAQTEAEVFSETVENEIYQYTVTDGEATIVDAEVKGDIVIPETLGGYPVVALGDKAFYYLWDLTSVTVPGCVKTIGDSCFANCINMKSAVLEDGVETIGADAFFSFMMDAENEVEYGSALESVVLPDSVRSIGAYAFNETFLSGELTLPASLVYLGEEAFGYTNIETLRIPAGMAYNKDIYFSRFSNLKEILVDTNNTDYYMDGELLMGNGGTVALYFVGYNETVAVVPNTVKVIEKTCFANTKVQQVILPENLLEIREKAFCCCDALTDITMPVTLKTVGENAFSECLSLEQIVFSSETLTLGACAFSDCEKLKEVSFTGKDVSIGQRAFYQCYNLKQLVLSSEKMHLGASLFAKTGIETLELRTNNVTTDPDLYLERELYHPGYKDNNIQKLVIGKDVTKLNEVLYLPVTIWQIELEEGNTAFEIDNNVLYNHNKTELIRFFSNSEKYTDRDTFIVPETVTKIGDKAFLGSRVKLVELPSSLEIIGAQAFYNSGVIGSKEDYHFILPASVKKIGARAFGKTPIRHFNIIGDNLEKLAPNMFQGCYALTDIYYTGAKEVLDSIVVYTEGSYLSNSRFHYNTTSAEHPFVETIGKKATAESNGYYLHTCPCGQSYNTVIKRVSSIEIGYHSVEKRFYHHLYNDDLEKLEFGVDYTYEVSSQKDGCLTFEITFIGTRYEGSVTQEDHIYVFPVKSLTANETTIDSVTLTWKEQQKKDMPIVAGYKISRYNFEKGNWDIIASTTELSYTDTALSAGKNYQYKVVPYLDVDGICEMIGDNCETVSATTAKDPPADADK